MTSNLGSEIILENTLNAMLSEREFDETKDKVMDLMKDHFKPEFLNRVDDIIVFHQLEKDKENKEEYIIHHLKKTKKDFLRYGFEMLYNSLIV